MSLRINNVAAYSTERYMDEASKAFEHSVKALASGNRITQASDDAAGLAIGDQLQGQMRGVRQAKMNAENAVSLSQVAEGGLNEQSNILLRMRELSIQAASDTVSDEERGYINQEFVQLLKEMDRIAHTTTFGSKKLLEGNGPQLDFHLGWGPGPQNVVSIVLDGNSTASELGVDGLEISTKSDSRSAMPDIDRALSKIGTIRAKYGAFQARVESARNALEVQYEGVAEARSKIVDVNVAEETANMMQAKLRLEAASSVMTQAMSLPQSAQRLVQML